MARSHSYAVLSSLSGRYREATRIQIFVRVHTRDQCSDLLIDPVRDGGIKGPIIDIGNEDRAHAGTYIPVGFPLRLCPRYLRGATRRSALDRQGTEVDARSMPSASISIQNLADPLYISQGPRTA